MRIVENVVRRTLEGILNRPMKLTEDVDVSPELQYHLDKNIPLCENRFEVYSKSFINLINEVRYLYENDLIDLNDEDRFIVESDLGKKVITESGQVVYLEVPVEESYAGGEAFFCYFEHPRAVVDAG